MSNKNPKITNPNLVSYATKMRKNMTEEEKRIWYEYLKKANPRFLRQKPIGKYIVDFCSPKLKLIIEIDGIQHFTDEGYVYDHFRTDFLEKNGYRVYGISNDDIREDLGTALFWLDKVCKDRARELGVEFKSPVVPYVDSWYYD